MTRGIITVRVEIALNNEDDPGVWMQTNQRTEVASRMNDDTDLPDVVAAIAAVHVLQNAIDGLKAQNPEGFST